MKPDLPLPLRLVDSCRDKAASVSTSTKRPRRGFSTRGIGEILDSDADLVRSVAAVSLAASAGLSPEGLQLSSPDVPIDPAEALSH